MDSPGISNGEQAHVTLDNTFNPPFSPTLGTTNGNASNQFRYNVNLNLNNNNYTVGALNVPFGTWKLSDGTLVFNSSKNPSGKIEYNGTQTFILVTRLELQTNAVFKVSDAAGTIRLLSPITGKGSLVKSGPGILLIEAAVNTTEKSRLQLVGGTTGIAPNSLDNHNIDVFEDSKLFALKSDINITGDLFISKDLNISDDPKPNSPGDPAQPFWHYFFGRQIW